VLRHTFTGAGPAGTYYWFGVLTRAGTSIANTTNWVGFDYGSFIFTP
jgi:hypothetical protein